MRSRQLWFFLLGIVLFWALPPLCNAASSVAGVLSSHGKLLVKRKGAAKFVDLSANGVLYVGDMVGTGPAGKAKLLFNDGSQFSLNANSAVEITAPIKTNGRQSFVRALSGQIWARLRPGSAVQTPSATLGVAGTVINLSIAEDGATTLTVVDGEVDFYNKFGATVVSTSQQSTARPDAAPTTPVTVPNAGLIIEWTFDLDQAVIPREKFFTDTPGIRTALASEIARRAKEVAAQPDSAESNLQYGDALFDAGDFAKALSTWQRADQIAPRQTSTLTRLGYAHFELSSFDEAQRAFEMALQANANYVPALIGAAQLRLAQNRPQEAQTIAERALATDKKSAEANIALGLALMRQPAKSNEAKAAFEAALQGEAAAYHYQAHAWLALVAVAQSNGALAINQGQMATKMAPFSALAHGNLALAYFYGGDAQQSEREARLAAALSPNSPAARVALGQALLARGDVDGAQRMAAQAVALDPQLAPAHYLLGIAGAQRRDYRHAVSDLKESLRLAPDYLPAAAGLARVYTRMGRKTEAIAVLTDVQARLPGNKDVLSALGEFYYEQADYPKAIKMFQDAIKQAPSALAYAGLAKVALDANRLDLAISAGQKAVQLAPQIAQYHAVLGQIYSFSGLNSQSQRELRTALALDPQNAFALAQFSQQLVEGDPRATQRTQDIGTRQAFLLDPAISEQLLRGGINTEATAAGGSRNWNANLKHRDRALDGDFNAIGSIEQRQDKGERANDDAGRFVADQNLTYSINPKTNAYLNLTHLEISEGLPGTLTKPVLDDRNKIRLNEAVLGGRKRIARQAYLWAGYRDFVSRDDRFNPGRDSSFRGSKAISLINVPQSLRRADVVSREVRLDLPTNFLSSSTGLFTVGATQLRTRQKTTQLFSNAIGLKEDLGILVQPNLVDTDIAYLQLGQRLGQRLSFAGQLRYQKQKVAIDSIFTSLSPTLPRFDLAPERSKDSDVMPSLVANYQLTPKTQLRFITNHRSTDVATSIFIPVDSNTSTEDQTLPFGLPDDMKSYEVDAEHYFGPGSFLKFFLFRTTADSTKYNVSGFSNPNSGNNVSRELLLTDVKRTGAGIRFEHSFTRSLFGQALLAVNKTTGNTPGVAVKGQTLPYHPNNQAAVGLNYVNASGTKLGLQINRIGSFFDDMGTAGGGPRPRFPAKTYVDLTLAKESSVKHEVFLSVLNVFDSQRIIFNDVPTEGRRLVAGYTGRF